MYGLASLLVSLYWVMDNGTAEFLTCYILILIFIFYCCILNDKVLNSGNSTSIVTVSLWKIKCLLDSFYSSNWGPTCGSGGGVLLSYLKLIILLPGPFQYLSRNEVLKSGLVQLAQSWASHIARHLSFFLRYWGSDTFLRKLLWGLSEFVLKCLACCWLSVFAYC